MRPISSAPSPRPRPVNHADRAARLASARGFSMVEILITFTIMGLLVMVGVPSMGNWLRNSQIRNAAESIQNGINRARMEAVRRNTPMRFSLVSTNTSNALDNTCALSSTSASWVISVKDPTGKCATPPSDTTIPMIVESWARNDGAAAVTITVKGSTDCTAASTSTSVNFDTYGRVATGTTPMRCILIDHSTVSADNRPLRIIISASNVRLCDPNAAIPATDPRHC